MNFGGIPVDEWCDYSPFDVHSSGGPYEFHGPIYTCGYCEQIVMRRWCSNGSWNWAVPPIFEECP